MSKKITSKFNGKCSACGCRVPAGTTVLFDTTSRTITHETINACAAAKKAQASAPAPIISTINIAPIADFIRNANARGLKSPKLHVLHHDNSSEITLAMTKTGVAPGSISVVVAGSFVGCVRPNNEMTGALASDTALQNHLLIVAKDPVKAAKDFAVLTGRCSFCGLVLTDAGSVEVGYGPVCAKHWGLPHVAKGTPALAIVPQPAAPAGLLSA